MIFNIDLIKDAYYESGERYVIFKPLILWEPPIEVSYWIMEQPDKLEAYCQWIFKTFPLEEVGKYTGTSDEVYKKEFNGLEYDQFFYRHSGQDQIDYVRKTVKEYLSKGFEIKYYLQY